MTDAFEDLREQIESRLVVPPFDHIRQRRNRKTRVAGAVASAAAVTAIVAGAALLAPSTGERSGADIFVAADSAEPSTKSAPASPAPSPSPGTTVLSSGEPAPAVIEANVATPRVLVTAPGWKLAWVDESYPVGATGIGKVPFENGKTSVSLRFMAAAQHGSYLKDRSPGPSVPIVVDGHDGVLVHYAGVGGEYGAIWLAGEHSLELRGPADSEADFRALVETVETVDETTWRAALPASAIEAGERDAVVAEMRAGVPTPPKFDESRLAGKGIADRYQLGALVAGQLACGWFDEWVDADKSGDVDRKAVAEAALSSSRKWGVLLEMVEPGDYAEALWEYVDALDGRDLSAGKAGITIRDRGYVDGLGCEQP